MRQLEHKVHAIHFEGFSISEVNPIAHGQVFVVPLKVIELSHVKHYEILFGLHVLQLEIVVQLIQNDKLLIS